MKRCYKCGLPKGPGDFNLDCSRLDGLANICRTCKNEQKRKSYIPKKFCRVAKGAKRKERMMKARGIRKDIIAEYKRSGCCLCGYNKCLNSLEFHHVSANKEATISGMHLSSVRVRAELVKCICICANCHREIHASLVKGLDHIETIRIRSSENQGLLFEE